MAKLLVIDDSELVPAMLTRILKRHGNHRVLAAANGQEGLDLVAKHSDIELIFLDLVMPVMDGFEFLKKFKVEIDQDNSIPVVVLSSKDKSDGNYALELGAISYLSKPVQLRELAVVVAKTLQLSRDKATGS